MLADNSLASGSAISNRLGLNATGTVNLQGGTLRVNGNGNDATTTTENITTFNVVNGGGSLVLAADAGSQLNMTITTLSSLNGTGTAVFRGIDGSVSATGKATLAITTPAVAASQGGGANGTTNMSVRGDILADSSISGLGTGFLVKDTAVGGTYRALGGATGLASTEYNLTPATWGDNQNAGINGTAQTISTNTQANTMTVGGASSLGSGLNTTTFGIYGPGGLLTQSLSDAAAFLALDGSTTSINLGRAE